MEVYSLEKLAQNQKQKAEAMQDHSDRYDSEEEAHDTLERNSQDQADSQSETLDAADVESVERRRPTLGGKRKPTQRQLEALQKGRDRAKNRAKERKERQVIEMLESHGDKFRAMFDSWSKESRSEEKSDDASAKKPRSTTVDEAETKSETKEVSRSVETKATPQTEPSKSLPNHVVGTEVPKATQPTPSSMSDSHIHSFMQRLDAMNASLEPVRRFMEQQERQSADRQRYLQSLFKPGNATSVSAHAFQKRANVVGTSVYSGVGGAKKGKFRW